MSNILFITEGPEDEKDFLEKMFDICYKYKKYEIYSYNTTIHTLVDILFDEDGNIDEDLDIKLTLRENEKDEEKRKILSQKYTEIFLIFDFEPQHNKLKFREVKQLLNIFNDSTDKGKLYVNYPMMQSYKHINKMPDRDFKDRKVTLQEVYNYKDIVASKTSYQDLRKYNYPILISMMLHHLMKINYILNGTYEIPDKNTFYKFDFSKLYNIQLKLIKNERMVYVVNTCILNIIEYNATRFLEQINNQKERFYI